jgi:hypothetical protein
MPTEGLMVDATPSLTKEDEEKLSAAGRAFNKATGMTDEEFQKHIEYASNRKLILKKEELDKYRFVAEVVESRNCGARIKVGQKYIIKSIPNMLLVEESDCPLCIKALGPVSNLMHGFWERIVEGLDPNEGFWSHARCLDPGVEYGGKGSVAFRVYAERIE